MRLALPLVALVTLAPRPAAAEDAPAPCRPRVRLMESSGRCDVNIVPINLSAGYGGVMDSTTSVGAAFLGADAVTVIWGSIFSTLAEARVALYTVCSAGSSGDGDGCGIVGDMFVGHAAGYALALDRRGQHHVVFGGAVGWGVIGGSWGGRVGGDGGLVLSPFVRYAFMGFIGVEVQALLPVTGDLGENYPAAISVSVTGVPLLVAMAFR